MYHARSTIELCHGAKDSDQGRYISVAESFSNPTLVILSGLFDEIVILLDLHWAENVHFHLFIFDSCDP